MRAINWIVLTVTGVLVALCVHFYSPTPLAFKPISGAAFAGLIAWLFAVALFVERAVEVITMIFRDADADRLVEDCTNAQRTKDDQLIQQTRVALITYRAKTKQIAQFVSFTFGILISLAGVRALATLVTDNSAPTELFIFLDVVTTGLVIAGGSEGIHQMANAFSSIMDAIQKKASTP